MLLLTVLQSCSAPAVTIADRGRRENRRRERQGGYEDRGPCKKDTGQRTSPPLTIRTREHGMRGVGVGVGGVALLVCLVCNEASPFRLLSCSKKTCIAK